MRYYIYALIDPETQQVNYIGATSNLERRMREHSNPKTHLNNPKNKWILGLKERGKSPLMVCVEECEKQDTSQREEFWISAYKTAGAPLKNVRSSGKSKWLNEGVRR